MKKYRVIVVPEAQAGIREAFDFIHERAPLSAVRWLQELYRRIGTLESIPDRCPPAREREFFEEDLRQLVFRSYRIVFYADRPRRTVYILAILHARRRGTTSFSGPPVTG